MGLAETQISSSKTFPLPKIDISFIGPITIALLLRDNKNTLPKEMKEELTQKYKHLNIEVLSLEETEDLAQRCMSLAFSRRQEGFAAGAADLFLLVAQRRVELAVSEGCFSQAVWSAVSMDLTCASEAVTRCSASEKARLEDSIKCLTEAFKNPNEEAKFRINEYAMRHSRPRSFRV